MRPTNEALLISALVNTGDVTQGLAYGIEPEMMAGYQPEYRWLLSYYQTYGSSPTAEALLHKFRGFPLTESADVPFFCDEVLYGHQKRLAVQTVKQAATYLAEDDLDEALLALGSFTVPGRRSPLTNALGDTSFLDNYDTPIDALATPWDMLNAITGGIRRGNFWTLAARYGHGKSWLLGCQIRDALLAGKDVLLYSLEMPKEEILPRIHVLLGAALGEDVDHIKMRDRAIDRAKYRKIMDTISELVHGKLYIEDKGKVTSARVAAEAPQADLTVIDYLGLMHTNTGLPAIGDWRNMAVISNQLKEAAINSDARILAAAQINRDGDSGSKHPPRSKNLSQSDAIGQDSDVILMTKRIATDATVWLIDKNRHGMSNVEFWTAFEPNEGVFHQITEAAAEDRAYQRPYGDKGD